MTHFQQNIMIFVVFIIICLCMSVTTCYSISSSSANLKHDIVYYNYSSDSHGNYNFSFKSPDIEREESGQVINVGQPDQYIRVTGKYSYSEITEDENIKLKIFYYTADKDGYRIDRTETTLTASFQYKSYNLNLIRTLVGG